MSDIRFRLLILLHLVLVAASVGAMFLPDGYSQELSDAYAAEPSGWLSNDSWLSFGVIATLVFSWLLGVVGLLMFKSWGRTLSLYSTIVEYLVYPFMGPTISSALESTFLETSILVWGAVLALAYFSSVSARFGR